MAKAKKKPAKKLSRLDILGATVTALGARLEAADRAIDDLDEAICPRVAARLQAIEKIVGTKPSNHSFGDKGTLDVWGEKLEKRVLELEQRNLGPKDTLPFIQRTSLSDMAKRLSESLANTDKAEPTPSKSANAASRAPCTVGQIDAVARKINAVMGAPDWIKQSPEARQAHRQLAHKIIHAVQSVMG